ncbi:GNAT family N-acetyltransferase [Pseudalkalibacillus sp. Hm43]|uniref:GNAT family N-acetyltransferase n=1 Tax=Pseudalkalibacillus sp. Hm43 TaxID=3450742 RepID=UPI003F4241BD
MYIRHITSDDFLTILPKMNDWWGGREVSHLLPRFLCDHFQNTSFVVEEENEVTGFLIGFISQTREDEAYIHLVGIDPKQRKLGKGKRLYETFFEVIEKQHVNKVYVITSPINANSIEFHLHIGFEIIPGDKDINGLPVHSNYDGLGNDKVLFVKNLLG